MRALVIYYTQFGNTERVAEAIGDALQSRATVRMLRAQAVNRADLEQIDLLVAGTPTHMMKLPKDLSPILEGLPKGALKGVRVAAFDTSYKMSGLLSKFTAAKPLLKKLHRLGGKPLIGPETFLVVGKEGPLYDGEIERAKSWAESLLTRA